MKYLKYFENIEELDPFGEEEWDETQPESLFYLIFKYGKHILLGEYSSDGHITIPGCDNNGNLSDDQWRGKLKGVNPSYLSKIEIETIKGNEKVLNASGYFEHRGVDFLFSLSDFQEFMDKDIPIKYLTQETAKLIESVDFSDWDVQEEDEENLVSFDELIIGDDIRVVYDGGSEIAKVYGISYDSVMFLRPNGSEFYFTRDFADKNIKFYRL